MSKTRVTVWNENVHERQHAHIAEIYPKGLHETIAEGLRESSEIEARTATLEQPEHGLTDAVLAETDVLTWWGHAAHAQVEDKIVDRVQKRVLEGMGLIVLHSGHYAKIFKRLLGTTCSLTWREAGEKERLWVCNPAHPIARGIDRSFEIPHEEMYGEPFAIPNPDEVVFLSWVRRRRGLPFRLHLDAGCGKNLLLPSRPRELSDLSPEGGGQVIRNAVLWARPSGAWIGLLLEYSLR